MGNFFKKKKKKIMQITCKQKILGFVDKILCGKIGIDIFTGIKCSSGNILAYISSLNCKECFYTAYIYIYILGKNKQFWRAAI